MSTVPRTAELAAECERLAARLHAAWTEGLLATDALNVETTLRVVAKMLRDGRLDSPEAVGKRARAAISSEDVSR